MDGRLTSLEELVADAAQRLTELLDLRFCRFEAFPFDTQLPRVEPRRIVLPAAEPGLEPWSTDAGVELPIRFGDLTMARFVLVPHVATSGVAFSPKLRARAIEIAARVAPPLAAAWADDAYDAQLFSN